MKTQDISAVKNDKELMLVLSLLFDAIGMITYIIPGIAEPFDIIWAPISAFIMTKMYKGRVGKVAGVLNFIEEIIPFTDIIPSFTLTWIYTYYFQKGK